MALLNDDIFGKLQAFFSILRVQKMELACASTNTIFFVLRSAVLQNSALYCSVHFSVALCDMTAQQVETRVQEYVSHLHVHSLFCVVFIPTNLSSLPPGVMLRMYRSTAQI